jgi:tetratricopeptide (TPR) repeat protein
MPPISLAGGCLKIPEDFDDPNADPAAPSTAQELLDRHIAASGGAEPLRALPQRTAEARVVFLAQEGCEEGDQGCVAEQQEGQFVLYTTADGRMYRRMVVGDNILERGFDGEVGWQMQAQPQMLVYEDPAATPILREDALLHWYFDVADEGRDGLALELLASRKSEDGERDLDGIRWFAAGPSTPESEKWFDRETGLLYEEIERDTETGDVVRRVYTDYRDVDGVKVPWMIEQITEVEGYPDHVVELRMQVVHHRPVREELFAIPDLGPTEPEPDLLLGTLAEAKAKAEQEPDDVVAQIQHARWAFAAVHLDEARRAAERALDLDNNEFEARYILARIALLEGDTQTAEKQLRQALSTGLRPVEGARQLAWIHMRRGDWSKAAKDLEDAGHGDLAARYAAFSGKPLAGKMAGNGCTTAVDFSVEGGAVIVEVQADGEPLRLLLDTGASDLIISAGKARSLVIKTDAEAPLVAGGPLLRQGQVETLGLGDLSVANVPVTMFPDEQLGTVVGLPGVDGVLGVRPFAGRQVTVDIAAKRLEIVEPGRRCAKQLEANRVGAAIPFLLHETHYLYVIGRMNGAEGLYLLNTGMRGADLTANEGAYAHAGVGAPAMRPGQPTLARIDRFELGEYTREDLGAAWGFLQQNATIDGFRLDGMLGLPVLGRGRWTLDFEQQRLYISAPKPAAADSEPPPERVPPSTDGIPRGVPGGVPSSPPKQK